MRALILGGTQFIGRHIVDALLAAGHRVSSFNLAGPCLRWAELMRLLDDRKIVWVPAELIQAAGLFFRELPLSRPERGPRGSLMDVSSERAQAAGLTLADPAATMRDMRG